MKWLKAIGVAVLAVLAGLLGWLLRGGTTPRPSQQIKPPTQKEKDAVMKDIIDGKGL